MQIRIILCLFVLALSTKAVRAQLDAPTLGAQVTFDSPAKPVTKLVAALSVATGVKLASAPRFSKDILFLHVKESPLKEVLERIADVTGGEWILRDDTYHLVRTDQAEKREAQAEIDETLWHLRKAVSQLIDKSSKEVRTSLYYSMIRTLPKLVADLDLRTMAEMADGDRVVFASEPNRMQRPLGKRVNDVLQIIADDLNRNKPASAREQTPSSVLAILNSLGAPNGQTETPYRPPKALLSVLRQGPSFSLNLSLYNGNGRAVVFVFETLYADEVDRTMPGVKTLGPKIDGPDADFSFSEQVKEVTDWFAKGSRDAPMSQSTREKLLRPDINDPYSFEVSECLVQLAKHRKVSLIANIPDQFAAVESLFGGSLPTKINGYLSRLMVSPIVNLAQNGRWISVKPKRPAYTRATRLDRVAFAKFLQACKNGSAPLGACSDFAKANPTQAFVAASNAHILIFCPSLLGLGDSKMDWDMLCLYGALTIDQRRHIRDGNSLRLADLNSDQRRFVHRILFDGRPKITLQGVHLGVPESSLPMGSQTWRLEPTELMPDGIPAEGTLSVLARHVDAIRFPDETPDYQLGSIGAEGLGHQVFRADESGEDWSKWKVHFGQRDDYVCDFLVGPDATIRQQLFEDNFDLKAPAKIWSDLPANFRGDVDAAAKAVKDRMDEFRRKQPKPPPY